MVCIASRDGLRSLPDWLLGPGREAAPLEGLVTPSVALSLACSEFAVALAATTAAGELDVATVCP